jgi:hypothetical protein
MKNIREHQMKDRTLLQFVDSELSGTLISHGLISTDMYFDIFNPSPFWHKAKPIVEGMRETRPQIYENFEKLSEKRTNWKKKNSKNIE